MKSLKYSILLVLTILTINTQGDIIISKTGTVNKHRIINLTDYPDITVFAVFKDEDLPQYAHMGFTRVYQERNGVIMKHIHCSAKLFAVKKEYLKNRDDKDIDWEDKKNVISSNITILSDYDKTALKGIREVEHTYEIVGFNDTTMVLHKTKQVFKYWEKKADLVKNYDYEGDLSKLHQTFN